MQTEKTRTPQSSGRNKLHQDGYTTECTSCGETAVVPFAPISGKDVYCSDCFKDRKQNGLLKKRVLKEENERHPDVFSSIDLMSTTRTSIAKMGISTPTPIQAEAIPLLQSGVDVIGQARTGSGKTLAFTIPVVEQSSPNINAVQAIILAPTRELAIQIATVVRPFAERRSLKGALLYGGRSLAPEKKLLHRGPQIVIGTPGRTLDHIRQGNLVLKNLKVLVIDEADEMLDMGMAQDVEKIISATPSERQTVLFSATLPSWIKKTAQKHLNDPKTVAVDSEMHAPPDIEHIVYEINKADKFKALQVVLSQQSGPTLVFGRTKHGVKKLASQLADVGYQAEAMQGNLSQNGREHVMNKFRSGNLPVLVATNVAARGLDIEKIDTVINFDIPDSPQLFTHRTGRTGRMGRQGKSITFLMLDDLKKWQGIERFIHQ
ncbi:DEAD/DEAH box helicase, partial [Dehalococcoidia bacterium]|nr:DEAD/DEAH box helicase [Dehalococcoidia bacterium]